MLFKLLAAPVSIPLAGFGFILDQLVTMAERELYDEDQIREELLLLQLRLDDGEIGEDAYAEEEAAILARLRAARAYWREKYAATAEEDDAAVSVSVELPEPDVPVEGGR